MRMRYRIAAGVLAAAAAVLVFRELVGGSVVALLDPHGLVAAAERSVIFRTVGVMLIVAVPLLGTLYAFAWKYRDGAGAAYEPDTPHPPRNELLIWGVMAAFIAVLGTIAWGSTHRLDPYSPIAGSAKPLEVDVVALRWKWLFIYPDQGIATVNYLEFPAGTPVTFKLTADGPMSSFWIPQLGSQIYAMAAMQTRLNLEASSTGTYVGKDTEINGDGYAGMSFDAVSVTRKDFDEWVRSVKGSSRRLDRKAYAALVRPTTYDPPAFYSWADPGLYAWILAKDMRPGMYGPNDINPNVPTGPSSAPSSGAGVDTSTGGMQDMQQ